MIVRYLLILTCIAACGRDEVPAPPLPVAPPVAPKPVVAPPVEQPPPAAPVPATDLLSAIPADTALVVAALDPVPEPVWQRVRAEIDPSALKGGSSRDPIAAIGYAALGELANGLPSV